MTHHPSGAIFLVLVPLLLWRVYARVRRNVGRQRLKPSRPWITAVLFPLLLVVLTVATVWSPPALASLWGGALVGGLLGLVGLRMTRFERTPQGRFYTPDARIGIALSLLFFARIAYRIVQYGGAGFANAGGATDDPGDAFASGSHIAHSPLTLALFGMLAGYYIVYAVGLLRWMRQGETQP